MTISCGGAGTISAITFASFGNPTGFCGALKLGTCNSNNSMTVVQTACLGKASCVLTSSSAAFGGDPCNSVAKRLSVHVQCSQPGPGFTYWKFDDLDAGMEDFMGAQNNGTGHNSVVINFSTPPTWLYSNPDRSYYPDDPQGETWDYEQGTVLLDKSAVAFGEYYGRLVAHYTDGGFSDEYGTFIPSPYKYTIAVWENLNEVEGEHSNSPQSYAVIYDQMIAGMKKHAPKGSANMKWMGMALEGHNEWVSGGGTKMRDGGVTE